MIDAHVHLEKGPYTVEWLNRFVQNGIASGISEIYFLEHTHRFTECAALYDNFIEYNDFQRSWFKTRNTESLKGYLEFVNQCKKVTFPIKVHFGLEVCYSPEHEADIFKLLRSSCLDFSTGSIHWIDNWAFDHRKEHWKGKDINTEYRAYYKTMKRLVESSLFDHLSHPDSIKCFNFYPTIDLSAEYQDVAKSLQQSGMKAEFSAGLRNNYRHSELGINKVLLVELLKNEVTLITASDAHVPECVGMNIRECEEIIEEFRITISST